MLNVVFFDLIFEYVLSGFSNHILPMPSCFGVAKLVGYYDLIKKISEVKNPLSHQRS